MDPAWTADQRAAFDATLEWARTRFADRSPGGGEQHYREAWPHLGAHGLLGLCVPTRDGGSGYGAVDTALRLQAFGQGCPDTGLAFAAAAQLLACTVPITEFGTPALRQRLIPRLCSGELIAGNAMTEPDAGSDVSRLNASATKVDGGYELTGDKSFVTNGPVADVFVTYATTDPDAGHLGVTAFVVERSAPGVHPGEPFGKMGLASADAGEVRFDRCLVPADQVLGEPGQGAAVFQRSMRWERACLFAVYVGLLDRVQEQCVAHARSRRQFGHRIGDFQAVANRIADMLLRLESARSLLYRACRALDQDDGSGAGDTDLAIALSKLSVSEAAVAGAMDAVRTFASLGYRTDQGIETVLRDAVPSTIFSGTSDVQRMLIARELGL